MRRRTSGTLESAIVRGRVLFVAVAIGLLMAAGAEASASFEARSMARARADAVRELRSAVLPSGARKARRDPSVHRGLGPDLVACIQSYVVEDHGFWRVTGKPAAAWAWMQAHPPKHTGSIGECTLVKGGKTLRWTMWFFLPQQRNVTSRMISAVLLPAKGGGTAVRVNGIAVGEPHPNQAPCVISY
jgi:hypothetical protein